MSVARRFHAPVVLPADARCSVLRDAVVDVGDDGRISYCGSASTAPARPGVPRTDLSGILMPGMVNTHAHSAMTPLRGLGGDMSLGSWLNDVIWPAESRMRPADVRGGMLLGCLEMLGHGITTSAEMYFHAEEVVSAVLDAGMRALVAPVYFDAPGRGWRETVEFTSGWIDSDGLRFGPGERIELCYGPHSAYSLPFEALRRTGEESSARRALVHIHLCETLEEDRAQRARFQSVPLMLQAANLLPGRLLAAHAVHLSAADVEVLRVHGVGVAHCPGSNGKLASGTARVDRLRAARVPVGLGTDGPASNDQLDLWQEARLALLFARLAAGDPQALTASDAFLMATRIGAQALGRTDIGRLEAGAWADMVHMSTDNVYFAAGVDVPDRQLLADLVWGCGSRGVRDVWVAGEQVWDDALSTRVDAGEARKAVRAAAAWIAP
ncbi:amidohydrolase family protein [Streptomyces sp. NPDC048514]|uniref:amidohydrolase family protein n=1 Tax=Streptomyces sp. NPDC048514 TaxID=3365564 RepID=UPI00371EEA80